MDKNEKKLCNGEVVESAKTKAQFVLTSAKCVDSLKKDEVKVAQIKPNKILLRVDFDLILSTHFIDRFW